MNCKYCNPEKELIWYETLNWVVALNPDQAYLGRSKVISKRHLPHLSELTEFEWLDFARVVQSVESCIKSLFSAELFNWTCLNNDVYLNNNPDPHIHWHVRPRYRIVPSFEGQLFPDPEFGKHYDRSRRLVLEKSVLLVLVGILRRSVNKDLSKTV